MSLPTETVAKKIECYRVAIGLGTRIDTLQKHVTLALLS